MAVQYAKAMGLRVIAIDTGSSKKEMCEKLGAEGKFDSWEGQHMAFADSAASSQKPSSTSERLATLPSRSASLLARVRMR